MTDAREHATAEWVLAAVAIVLTAAVVIGSMFQHPRSREPDRPGGPPAAAPTTGPAPPPTAGSGGSARAANLVADPGFEAGLAGWLAIGGARVERTGPALAGRWAGGFTAGGRGDQGMVLPGVARCTPGRTYAADVWVRASRPGMLVQVTLLEVAGGRRLAADTSGPRSSRASGSGSRLPTTPTGRAPPWPWRSSSPPGRLRPPSWSTTWRWWPTGHPSCPQVEQGRRLASGRGGRAYLGQS